MDGLRCFLPMAGTSVAGRQAVAELFVLQAGWIWLLVARVIVV